MTKRTITIDDSELTDDNITDIVGTAAYGGISYWGSITDIGFGEYNVIESDEEIYIITREDIREAYFKLLNFDQSYVAKYIHQDIINSWQNRDSDGIDCGDIDAEAADVIIQIAVFGELVYG